MLFVTEPTGGLATAVEPTTAPVTEIVRSSNPPANIDAKLSVAVAVMISVTVDPPRLSEAAAIEPLAMRLPVTSKPALAVVFFPKNNLSSTC